ncbi:MAG TPA: HD domain-containing protein [Bryobacteraceae bacterium]|nr:HD domain-containing protein [Bryobacteraceae bacterium]
MNQLITENEFERALVFAARLHESQHRKGTPVPYISHLLAVASLVLEDEGSTEETVAALLHDAIEDQGDTYPGGRPVLRAGIRGQFGDRVLAIVDACTDDDRYRKGAAADEVAEAAAWRERKEAYIRRLQQTSDRGVLRVSCADKLHNARSILLDYRQHGPALWKRFRAKRREDHLWYYGELVRVFRGRAGRLAEELARTVDQLAACSAAEEPPPVSRTNSIRVIFPYRKQGTWMFDDQAVGLVEEPFVAGAPQMIDRVVADVPGASTGFKLLFSDQPFPGVQAELHRIREESEGNWYSLVGTQMEAWLCPALFKYFAEAPERIFCRAEPAGEANPLWRR